MSNKHISVPLLGGLLASALILSGCGGGSSVTPSYASYPIAVASSSKGLDGNAASVINYKFAYVANYDSALISTFHADIATGALTFMASSATGVGPGAITLHPSGKFAYVVNFESNDISIYTVHPNSGVLIPAGVAVATGEWPTALEIEPTGHFAYVPNYISNSVSTYAIDTQTGRLTALGTIATGINPRYLVIDPAGHYVYTANWGSKDISMYRIHASSGLLTSIRAALPSPSTPFLLNVAPSGKYVYLTDFLTTTAEKSISILNLNALTGELSTPIPIEFAGAHPIALAFAHSGKFAYVANSLNGTSGNSISAYAMDAATGAMHPISCPSPEGCHAYDYTTGTNPSSITVDPSGNYVYVSNATSDDISTYRIDATNGALTKLATSTSTGEYPIDIKLMNPTSIN